MNHRLVLIYILISAIWSAPAHSDIDVILNDDGDGQGKTVNGLNGIALDAAGNLYAASGGNNEDYVFKITPGGVITAIIDATGDGLGNTMSFPYGIEIDPAGNLLVPAGGFGSNNVFRVTPGGVISELIDATGDGKGNTLDTPIYATGSPSGNVYVTGRETDNAFKITPGGVITEIIDSTGDGQGNVLDGPNDVVVDAAENVYVVGSFSSNVFKITPAGAITQIMDSTGDGLGNGMVAPEAIVIDGAGNLYVGARVSNTVLKRSTDGTISLVLGASGDGQGNELNSPRGLGLDAAGNLYVTGAFSYNAFRVTPQGQVTQIIDSTGNGEYSYLPPFVDGIAVAPDGTVYTPGAGANGSVLFRISPLSTFPAIANGSFDSSVTDGWSNPSGTASLAEAIGLPAPSAALSNDSAGTEIDSTVLSQCVPLEPGSSYDISADVFIEPGQERTGSASLEAAVFADGECGQGAEAAPTNVAGLRIGPRGNEVQANPVFETGEWQQAAVTVDAPESAAASVEIRLVVNKSEAAGVFTAHFDNVAISPPDDLFEDGFEPVP
jgi:sugar lactone lactonase YvrE